MNVAFTPLAIGSLKGLSKPELTKALQILYRIEEGDLSQAKRLKYDSYENLYVIRISENLRLLAIIAGTQALIVDSVERGTKLFKGVLDTILAYATDNELFELRARQKEGQSIEDSDPELAERLREKLVPDNAVDTWKVVKIIVAIILTSAGSSLVLSNSDIQINVGPLIDINEINIHINKESSSEVSKLTNQSQKETKQDDNSTEGQ